MLLFNIIRLQVLHLLMAVTATLSLLGLRVRIPLGPQMFVSCEYCMLCGRILCDVPIPCPGESYPVYVIDFGKVQ
jgi:hypothetical protein